MLQGNEAQAIAGYERAIEFGQRDVTTIQTLVALLYRAQRFADADRYLQQMRDVVPFSRSLSASRYSRTSSRSESFCFLSTSSILAAAANSDLNLSLASR